VKSSSDIAFKEWAVVCAALASGQQTIILRKGGIDEGRDDFRVEHSEFWLLPTRFHQDAAELKEDARPLLKRMNEQSPPTGKFLVELYAVVQKVFEVNEPTALDRIVDEHILSAATIKRRFDYRRPGLFVLVPQIYRVPRPHEVEDSDYIAGCKSWVALPQELSTAGAAPAFNDRAFAERMQRLAELIAG
jgi:hypothetical protein